ncbi:MAG: amidohydrolase [SAR202 cluster bacterium]|nr:amidohydrolase [SAR202 cluster bacterium]
MTTPPDAMVDAHHHFWDPARFAYRFLGDASSPLNRAFLPADLAPALAAEGVAKSVLVQAHPSPAETEWLLALAEDTDFVAGVVGWVDLAAPELPSILDRLQRHSKFKGVRRPVHNEPEPGYLLRPEVLRGLRELATRDLPFDLLVHPRDLRIIPEVAEAVPDLRMALNHIGRPDIASGYVEPWGTHMLRIAAHDRVWCKLSGLVTADAETGWRVARLTPFVDRVVRLFGHGRLMFGSDWPVCTQATSYGEVVAAARQAMGPATAEQAERVFGGAATEFYHLA